MPSPSYTAHDRPQSVTAHVFIMCIWSLLVWVYETVSDCFSDIVFRARVWLAERHHPDASHTLPLHHAENEPDTVYPWVVCGATVISNALSMGFLYSTTVYYDDILATYNVTRVDATWIGALANLQTDCRSSRVY